MNSLGYVFAIFTTDALQQFLLTSPFWACALGLLVTSILALRKRKHGRQLIGMAVFSTIAAYLVFILIEVSLPFTNTSYGAAQPVVIIFGLIFTLILGLGLVGFILALRSQRLARRWRRIGMSYALSQVLILGVLFYAFYIEPQWIDVTQTQIALAKIPPGTAPIKVALISDIHMERWTAREDDAIRKFNALQPDLIVVAGDHINIDHIETAALSDLHRFFGALHAKYGVYAVPGGVDTPYDLQGLLEGTDVKLLDDQYATVNINGVALNLVGIRHHFSEIDSPALQQVDSELPQNALKMLIYHTPDLAPESAAAGYDFYFAGHTHGGQIALPFFGAIYTASKYGRTYAAGLYNLGGTANTHLYVTRGIGMEGMNTPRARLFARPEISVITFVPDQGK